jgi:serine/threonine protein kinase/Flp pilus assembly protein TadD
MTVDFAKLREVFHAAVEQHAPEEWDAYLDQACAGDQDLRRHVAMLLKAHAEEGSLLGPALDENSTQSYEPSQGPGTIIGPYKLLEQIGEGGFGVVFMAEQQHPVRRKVALKVIKPGMDTRQVIARFEAERQALALMEHPNIARVLDAGTTEPAALASAETDALARAAGSDGRPYFVMELVRGPSMTEYCDQNHLPIRERLNLFINVCQAVQHAHQKGIIHRDIKPSNVLVTLHDGKPVVKVIDFGIAKAMGQQLTEKTLFTNFAAMIGTPLYMSPEQAEMSGLDVDTRSDIYALGVLLYELLTGTTPFDKERLKTASFDEIRRIIREEEPPKPSTRMSQSSPHAPREDCVTPSGTASVTRSVTATIETIATKRRSDPRKLSRLFRGELDWIVMKALEKDRNRRYETANAFAQDVQRYLRDEPVQACPPSVWYRFGKFARRNRIALSATVAALALFVTAGGGIWSWEHQQTLRRAEKAFHAELTRQSVESSLEQLPELHRRALWKQAETLLDQADQQLTPDGDSELRERVAQARRDTAFVKRLDDIRLDKSVNFEETPMFKVSRGTLLNFAGVSAKYQDVFLEHDLDILKDSPEDLAARLNASQFRDYLLAALDDWAMIEDREVDRKHILAVTAKATGQEWRLRLNDALTDGTKLAELFDSVPVDQRTPAIIWGVGSILLVLGEDGIRRMEEGLRQYPGDFWLHFDLGTGVGGKERADARIGACRAALVIRPDSPAVHNNLGAALADKGQEDDAIIEFREALRLRKDYAEAHNNLGLFLHRKGVLAEAIAEAHNNLGLFLYRKCLLAEAILEHHEAIRVSNRFAKAHACLGSALETDGQLDEAIAEYRKAIQLKSNFAEAHISLARALRNAPNMDEAIVEYRLGIQLGYDHTGIRFELGNALYERHRLEEAITEFRKAIWFKKDFAEAHYCLGTALRRKGLFNEAIDELHEFLGQNRDRPEAYYNLGAALRESHRLDEAIEAFREAIGLKKDYFIAHHDLAIALHNKGLLDEAIVEFRQAVDLKKDSAEAHNNLGNALQDKDLVDEAIKEYGEAIRLNKDYAEAHYNLGDALLSKGQPDAALAKFADAIRLKRDYARPHVGIGNILAARGQLDAALAEFREAVNIDKNYPEAHLNIGTVLLRKGEVEKAITELRATIQLKKDYPEAHLNLGSALQTAGCLGEAIDEFREAIRLKKDFAVAYCNLGLALQLQGEFRQALDELRRGHEIGSKNPQWGYPSEQWVRQCERQVELDKLLPGYLDGKTQPNTVAERMELCKLCLLKRLPRAAVRFYEEAVAVAVEPGLVDNPALPHRYNAACAAALAGCGLGKDSEELDAKERARLRQQALEWLRADLNAWEKALAKEPDKTPPIIVQVMRHWLANAAPFVGVRGPEALPKLPDAEQEQWQKLWDDVADMLNRSQGKSGSGNK